MHRKLLGMLVAALLVCAQPGLVLEAQGKGKGPEKSQADKDRGKGNDKAKGNERGKGNDLAKDNDKARGRAAEVRSAGGDVAKPSRSDLKEVRRDAKDDRKAFKSALKSGKYFRAFDADDTPDRWRAIAMSDRLRERYAGRVATLALARGVPEAALLLRPSEDRMVITNADGVVLLDLDDARVRNLGGWRVVTLDDRAGDDDDREGRPAFCRSGAGHPVWGRQWCVEKGFGLGSDSDVRWGRAIDPNDVIFREANTSGDLVRDVLGSVLGDVVLNRLAAHALTMGLVEPLHGRWIPEPTGRRVLLVSSGPAPVAEIVDTNRDSRADLLLLALRSW